jgi:hypothetical protein
VAIDAGRQPIDEFVAAAAPHALQVADALARAIKLSAGAIGSGFPK